MAAGKIYEVTGTLTPDATGTYAYAGEQAGKPYYERTPGGWAIWWDIEGWWNISHQVDDVGVNFWGRADPNIKGLYLSAGGAVGNATVSEVSITERIAEDIKAAINLITIANGFNQDLTALRRRRLDFSDVMPEDLKVLIIQAEDELPEQEAVGANEWLQVYFLEAFVIDSDTASTSIETRMSTVRDDIRKKLAEDTTRGGYAIDTMLRAATPFDDGEGFTGIELEIAVHYRTKWNDPYTRI